MKTKYLIIAAASVAAIVALCLPAYSTVNNNQSMDVHKYTISLDGTDGVRLRMLLVIKSGAKAPPTRRSEIVTTPFESSFKAKSFYVWFDTLEDGMSGNEGDRVAAEFLVDGERQGGGFGMTIKKQNKKSGSFGNL